MAQPVHHNQNNMAERNTQDLYPWLNGANLPERERRIASLEGAVAGHQFRLNELKITRCSIAVFEREERSLLAYERMLKEAKAS